MRDFGRHVGHVAKCKNGNNTNMYTGTLFASLYKRTANNTATMNAVRCAPSPHAPESAISRHPSASASTTAGGAGLCVCVCARRQLSDPKPPSTVV
jgi:hypothetical protein